MADNANQESKDSGDGSSEYIMLRAIGQETREIHFRLKSSTRLGKLKKSYCEIVGLPLSSLRFLFNGLRMDDDATPKQLEMVNDDIIEIYREHGRECSIGWLKMFTNFHLNSKG